MEENPNEDHNRPLQIDNLEKMEDSKDNDDSYILGKERPSNADNFALQNRFTTVENNFQEDDSKNNDSLVNMTNSERPSNESEISNNNKTKNHKKNNDKKKDNIKSKQKEKNTKKLTIEIKLILLGDVYVGKTSILGRYTDNLFREDYKCTLQVEMKSKIIDIDLDTRVKMNIWDTMGQEKFRNITTQYYRNCQGAVIVFDLTQKKTFEGVQKWINDLKQICKNVTILILGNKSDLTKDIAVNRDEIENFVKDKYLYYDVSAKNGTNVSLAFDKIRSEIIEDIRRKEKKEDKEINDIKFQMRNIDSKEIDNLDESVNGKSKKCC